MGTHHFLHIHVWSYTCPQGSNFEVDCSVSDTIYGSSFRLPRVPRCEPIAMPLESRWCGSIAETRPLACGTHVTISVYVWVVGGELLRGFRALTLWSMVLSIIMWSVLRTRENTWDARTAPPTIAIVPLVEPRFNCCLHAISLRQVFVFFPWGGGVLPSPHGLKGQATVGCTVKVASLAAVQDDTPT